MSTVLQFTPNPLEPERARVQRNALREWVVRNASDTRDAVVLVEPDHEQAQVLRDLWADEPDVTIVDAAIADDAHQRTVEMFRTTHQDHLNGPLTRNRAALLRRFPSAEVETLTMPAMTVDRVLEQAAPSGDIRLIAIDAATPDLARLTVSRNLERVQAVAIAYDEVLSFDPSVSQAISALRGEGFVLSGRPWGEAGEALLLVRAGSMIERLTAVRHQARAEAGRAIVTARDSWFGPAQRAKALLPIRVAASKTLTRADRLDDRPTTSLHQLPLRVVEAALDRAEAQEPELWAPPAMPIDDPWALAQECHDRHGVWPISFSYPRRAWPINPEPDALVSPITPGLPYSFDDEDAYRRTYANAYWGITHRKAGWDCFRHVEIMGAGSTPWMLDAAEIPRYSMVHYPKGALAVAATAMKQALRRPDPEFRQHIHQHFEQHLTSRAMAQYLLRAAGLEDAQTVLFVDERLPHHADYQSMLTLIGLKQLLGANCHVRFPVDYLYDDYTVDIATLYGRGFGYTRVLPSQARSTTERGSAIATQELDAIMVGSVTRNSLLASALLHEFPAERTVWIHGEDLPPTVDEVATYRRSRVHMFVRAIHQSR